ncbi:MAG: hypothetical protein JO018_04110 [Candidatus Eremiobacteraeota bacterium]|nr:hypothetical protein [Candidatus Eremiobacteraeota bacterium]MBV9402895.1 hypothetical protein [Candidatus Eremiobacteraeota bacterium]
MFDQLKGMAEQVMSGNVDQQQVQQAASDHLDSMDQGEIADHLQTAASNMQNQGQDGLAQQAMGLVSQLKSGGDAKSAVVQFIASNPQVLQHFAPSFAQGILSRL